MTREQARQLYEEAKDNARRRNECKQHSFDEGSGLMELEKFTAPAAIHLKHLLDEAANKMVLKAKDLRDRAEIEADNKNGDPRYKNHFLSQERDARKTAELFSELSKAALTQAYIAMKNEDATK